MIESKGIFWGQVHISFLFYTERQKEHKHDFLFLLWLQTSHLKDRLCFRLKIVYKKHLSESTMFLFKFCMLETTSSCHNHVWFKNFISDERENKCRNLLSAVIIESDSVFCVLMSFFISRVLTNEFTVHSITNENFVSAATIFLYPATFIFDEPISILFLQFIWSNGFSFCFCDSILFQ